MPSDRDSQRSSDVSSFRSVDEPAPVSEAKSEEGADGSADAGKKSGDASPGRKKSGDASPDRKKSGDASLDRKKSGDASLDRKKSGESVSATDVKRKESTESKGKDKGKSRDKGKDRDKSKDKDKGKGKDEEKEKNKEKEKTKGKGIDEKRGSLKFGEDDEPPKGKDKKEKKGKKQQEEEKPAKGGFDASKYKKPTIVVFHDNDDLALGKGVGYRPDDAMPKAGPGVTADIEKLYGPCNLLSEFKYTTWASTVVPLKNHNIVQGFNEMTMCLLKLAANEGENMSHEDAFLAVSFLSNVRNDLGEYPPNILALMEHIDYITKGDASPKFRQMDGCKMNQWY